jgi:hypothetical protein
MNAIFLREARQEMLDSAAFYEQQRSGLGHRFLDAVDLAVADIQEHPRRWPVIGKRTRRRLLGRFPYGILYRVTRSEIVIIAVMHLHRHPRYWTGRLP